MKEEVKERGISIETALSKELDPLFFDRAQIRQAFSNLVRNACEAMPGGGVLSIETSIESEMIELRVSDTGSGVPEEAADHIFESFFSTKSAGTGLGLPLVRQICIAHGGDAWLKETSDAGSCFALSLPRTKPNEAIIDNEQEKESTS